MTVVHLQREEESLLEQARRRGTESRQRILHAEEGTVPTSQVAEYLHISRQAVDERRKRGKLLALEVGAHAYAYPVWQLTQDGVLPGLEEALAALSDWDAWTQAAFMLNGNVRLQGQSPLHALRLGEREAVIEAAMSFGEHR